MKKGSWNQMIKNDPNFGDKYELNTNSTGPTFVPRGSNNSDDSDEYHPSNPSFDDFSNLAHNNAADDL